MGAFPKKNGKVFGGFVTVCNALLESSFQDKFRLILIDSTQTSNPPPNFLIRTGFALRRFFLFVYHLILEKPQAVLIFTASGFGLLEKGMMGRLAQVRGVPNLMFPGGGYLLKNYDNSLRMRFFSSIALKKADKILCQGKQWQDFAVEKLGFSLENTPIVENWTATEKFLKIGDERDFSDISDKKIRVLFVGWLDREKGVMEILDALVHSSLSQSISLELVGEGNAYMDAREWVEKNSLSEIVSFRGWLQAGDLEAAYRNADVFLLPSWMEGLPNAMVEAMAAGLVPVVSAVGNIPSVVTHGENGLLVQPKDSRSIELALQQILLDRSLVEKLGKKACQFARENFSTEVAVGKLTKVLLEVINSSSTK